MPGAAAAHRRDRLLAVEEPDRADRGRRAGEHGQRRPCAGTHSRISGVSQVIVGPSTTLIRPAGERGVRQQLVADGVDVLRLLEVGRGRLHLALAGACSAGASRRDREERDPARPGRRRPRRSAPGRSRSRASTGRRRRRGRARAARSSAGRPRRAREQAEQRRLHVVDPGAEDVRAAERAAGEQVAPGVDRDVVRLRAREDGARRADVERVVDRQVVDVDRQCRRSPGRRSRPASRGTTGGRASPATRRSRRRRR